jgi:hypothetical protein
MKTARAIALMTETASTSETSVNLYQTARHNNTEDSHLGPSISCFYSTDEIETIAKARKL